MLDEKFEPWKNAKYRQEDLTKDKIKPTEENMQSLAEQLLGGDGAIDIIWGPADPTDQSQNLPTGRCGQGKTVDVSNVPPYEGEELLADKKIPMIQRINVSANLGREEMLELGKRKPYFRYVNFDKELENLKEGAD